MSFETAYDRMIRQEGGYKLTDIKNDRGGQTYAGIARKLHPHWIGWTDIDDGRIPATDLVRGFYRQQFWQPIKGDKLPPEIADSMFNFGVNAGVKTAIKLAQIAVGAQPDGDIGQKTISALQSIEPEKFRLRYALAKTKRYAEIVNRDRSQGKFLLGWINRTLEGV